MDIQALILLARAISAQHGVNVKFYGRSTACCTFDSGDGKFTIELPLSTNEDAELFYRGYLDHEVGHVRFTDFDLPRASSDIEASLCNVFEDEYVERQMGTLFPGSKINLRNLARHIFNEEHVRKALASDPMSRLFAFALYHRRSMLDPELGKWNDMIDKSLGVDDKTLAKMLEIVKRPTHCTEDNNKCAADLLALFPQDQNQSGDQQDQSGGQQDEKMSLNDFSVSRQVVSALSANTNLREFPEIYKLLFDGSCLTEISPRLFPIALNEYLVSVLRKRIPPFLQTSRIRPSIIGKRGKLCGKRLARAVTLDPRVFISRAPKLVQEMEIGFLSDYSGSMAGNPVAIMDEALYATLVMLKELPKVKSFAYGFNGTVYCRLCDKNTQRLVNFATPKAMDSTPLGPAMLNIAQEFDENCRRILFVTTDGEPDEKFEHVIAVRDMIAKMGIEIYGIGMGSVAAYMRDLFGDDNVVIIEDIQDYPVKLEATLRKAMLCAN